MDARKVKERRRKGDSLTGCFSVNMYDEKGTGYFSVNMKNS
jgi:hypothetical protein